jgi:hypothetical protein
MSTSQEVTRRLAQAGHPAVGSLGFRAATGLIEHACAASLRTAGRVVAMAVLPVKEVPCGACAEGRRARKLPTAADPRREEL